jgi:glycosyltransferase involved in cell wall biosynthesis
MRVLITTDVVGGVWQFTHEIAAGLLREGSPVALVSFGGAPTPEQQGQCARLMAEYGGSFVYESSSAPLEWMQQNGRAYHEAAPLLLQMAEDLDADLLHTSQFCFGALPLAIPKVITAHSDVLSWADACRDRPLEDSQWLRQYCDLVTAGLRGASSVIAPTRWMLEALQRNFSLPSPGEVIPNGRTLPPASSSSPQLRAVTAGRLWDQAKDIRLLADVSPRIPLYIAGQPQHEAVRATLEFGSATLLGRLPEPELLQFFRESAIYVCTSRYEPFGLAPLEAALCGCAVLARDIPSLREVWRDSARYFSDAQALESLLEELAADPDSLVAAQRRSKARARLFTAERMVCSYKAHFARALKEFEAGTYAA